SVSRAGDPTDDFEMDDPLSEPERQAMIWALMQPLTGSATPPETDGGLSEEDRERMIRALKGQLIRPASAAVGSDRMDGYAQTTARRAPPLDWSAPLTPADPAG